PYTRYELLRPGWLGKLRLVRRLRSWVHGYQRTFCHWNRYPVARIFSPCSLNFTGPCTDWYVLPEWSSAISFVLSMLLILVAACLNTCPTAKASATSELILSAVPPYFARKSFTICAFWKVLIEGYHPPFGTYTPSAFFTPPLALV